MVTQKAMRIVKAILRLGLLTGGVMLLATLLRPICVDSGVCNYLLLTILVGIPFGIGKMILILPPASYDIGGSVGVLALDFLMGGILGCFAIAYQISVEIIRLIIAVIE